MYIFLHATVVGRQLAANPPRGMMWHRSIKNFGGRGYGRKTEKELPLWRDFHFASEILVKR
jgi:hypothetical protein